MALCYVYNCGGVCLYTALQDHFSCFKVLYILLENYINKQTIKKNLQIFPKLKEHKTKV